MKQLLLFDDPRPLVDRLGRQFFRDAPQCPGVYLMRDEADNVLYVGKARNLRKRLSNYRVANPERLRRRHLKLLGTVARIELEQCEDETAALARESQLLRSLRPRFNRAGTWVGIRRFISWKITERGLELAVTSAVEPGWKFFGPLGSSANLLQAILVRLFWCGLCPRRSYAEMPHGWARSGTGANVCLRFGSLHRHVFEQGIIGLSAALGGEPDRFLAWVRERTAQVTHRFERAMIEMDLSSLLEFIQKSFAPGLAPPTQSKF